MHRESLKEQYRSWKRRAGLLAACGIKRLRPKIHAEGFGILMYHRVTNPTKGLRPPTWNVTPNRFHEQLSGLLKLGYKAQPLREVLTRHNAGEPIPPNWFIVTFDDVYENVYRNAWPILKELSIPATLFLSTQYLDSPDPFPFDDWTHKGQEGVSVNDWKPIQTAQCMEMQESGLIELGAHTHSHEDFRGRAQDFYNDLLVCRNELYTRFGVEKPTFAFPYGTKATGFSGGELTLAARNAGVSCCLTTEDEQVLASSDPFDWGRFTAEQTDTAATLAAKLAGYFTLLKETWRKLSRKTLQQI